MPPCARRTERRSFFLSRRSLSQTHMFTEFCNSDFVGNQSALCATMCRSEWRGADRKDKKIRRCRQYPNGGLRIITRQHISHMRGSTGFVWATLKVGGHETVGRPREPPLSDAQKQARREKKTLSKQVARAKVKAESAEKARPSKVSFSLRRVAARRSPRPSHRTRRRA